MNYKILIILFLFFKYNTSIGQLVITNVTATEAANALVGYGVTISNATFTGNPLQLATFTNGGITGITEGVIITTGDAKFATTRNTSDKSNEDPVENTANFDKDLSRVQSNLKGPAVLEFDIVTTGINLQFDYVFASEEYIEYVNSSYNDVFGLFISGPGINGTYSNNGVNIALVTNTTSHVSVNTVNHLTNSSFYRDNWQNNAHLDNPFPYDGYTFPFRARRRVECGKTYHIRIAISNVADTQKDAAVFIEKGSLKSDFVLGDIVADVQPICEGQTLNLTVQGEELIYHWSNGQSGIGLKTISTVADLSAPNYSVTAFKGSCSITKSINLDIHPLDNVAPYVNGVNNTNEFLFVMKAGEESCFNIPSIDNLNEVVTINWDGNIPSAIWTDNGGFHETGTFCWKPSSSDIGFHTFTVTVTDQNRCGVLSQDFTFRVKVVCDFCPIDVYYENRKPYYRPLPEKTVAGYSIVAGRSVDPTQEDGQVLTGTEDVEFRAPKIVLEPGFIGGPGFVAIPDEGSCVEECEKCCKNWKGFTYDFVPNIFSPNGDGKNDIWYLPNWKNPFCAYNAREFELTIKNRYGNTVHYLSSTDNPCCPFVSPSPNHDIPHASIFWDGTARNTGETVSSGSYFLVLTLGGCENSIVITELITVLAGSFSSANNMDNPELDLFVLDNVSELDKYGIKGELTGVDAKVDFIIKDKPLIYPNPAKDIVTIDLLTKDSNIQLLTIEGKVLLERKAGNLTEQINMANFEKGIYFIRINWDEDNYIEKIIKE